LGEQIIESLRASGGVSTLTDKSQPDEIYRTFKVSKKKYKQALGSLYRSKRILLSAEKIQLVE